MRASFSTQFRMKYISEKNESRKNIIERGKYIFQSFNREYTFFFASQYSLELIFLNYSVYNKFTT